MSQSTIEAFWRTDGHIWELKVCHWSRGDGGCHRGFSPVWEGGVDEEEGKAKSKSNHYNPTSLGNFGFTGWNVRESMNAWRLQKLPQVVHFYLHWFDRYERTAFHIFCQPDWLRSWFCCWPLTRHSRYIYLLMVPHLKAFWRNTNKAFNRYVFYITFVLTSFQTGINLKCWINNQQIQINWTFHIAAWNNLLFVKQVVRELLQWQTGCFNNSDTSFCWNQVQLFQTEHSTSIFPSDLHTSWESRYLGKETQSRCVIKDHKLKLKSIPFVGELKVTSGWGSCNAVEKVAVTWSNCNYCRATSSQWALSDSHCPLLCTSHPGKTNIHERNMGGGGDNEFVDWVIGPNSTVVMLKLYPSKTNPGRYDFDNIVQSLPFTFVWPM